MKNVGRHWVGKAVFGSIILSISSETSSIGQRSLPFGQKTGGRKAGSGAKGAGYLGHRGC